MRLVVRCLIYFHIMESDMQAPLDFVIAAQAPLIRDTRKSMLFSLDDESDGGIMSHHFGSSPTSEETGESPRGLRQWYTWVYHEQRKRLVCAVIVRPFSIPLDHGITLLVVFRLSIVAVA